MSVRQRLTMVTVGWLACAGFAGAATMSVPASMTVVQGNTAIVIVSGSISPTELTGGYSILVELVPQTGTTGTLTFTPSIPGDNTSIDIVELNDPFGGGAFTAQDTATGGTNGTGTGSDLEQVVTKLNANLGLPESLGRCNGGTSPGAPCTSAATCGGGTCDGFSGQLVRFPVIAGASATGTWDVKLTLSTTGQASRWNPATGTGAITTVRAEGTITVTLPACNNNAQCDDGNPCTDNICANNLCTFPNHTKPCDDGDVCTVNDVCGGGSCAGTPADCSASDTACTRATCDPSGSTLNCNGTPINKTNGTSCGDPSSTICDGADQCLGGVCDSNFAPSTTVCRASTGTCDTAETCDGAGHCPADGKAADGTACIDGNNCTEVDVCTGGTCAGTPKDCSLLNDECNTGVCNPADGSCMVQPLPDGTPCPDDTCLGSTNAGALCSVDADCPGGMCDNQCTTNERCAMGSCTTDPIALCVPCTPATAATDCAPGTCETAQCINQVCVFTPDAACPTLTLVSDRRCYDPLRTCSGGDTPGATCSTDADCLGTAPTPNGTCDAPNSGICTGGTNDGTNCLSDANCTGGGTCTAGLTRLCIGGPTPGSPCTGDVDCGGGGCKVPDEVTVDIVMNGMGSETNQCINNPLTTCNVDADCPVGDTCNKIISGQFFLEYDPNTLKVLSIVPGFDFPTVLTEDTSVPGQIDYSVLVGLPTSPSPPVTGNSDDGTSMATFIFQAVAECDPSPTVRFRATSVTDVSDAIPRSIDAVTQPTGLNLVELDPIRIDGVAPSFGISCPASISMVADAGTLTADVVWDAPIASDTCDGPQTVLCMRSSGICSGGTENGFACARDADCLGGGTCTGIVSAPTGLSGGTFDAGTTQITCTATDTCGNVGICPFDVLIYTENELVADVQLEALGTAVTRCITFELWNRCGNACTGGTNDGLACTTAIDCPGGTCDPPTVSATVKKTIAFDTVGPSADVSVLVPAGVYSCITARDEQHSLRSTAPSLTIQPSICNGGDNSGGACSSDADCTGTAPTLNGTCSLGLQYRASFTGNPATGGHWLVGGDFDDNGKIDILDFARLIREWGPIMPGVDTTCTSAFACIGGANAGLGCLVDADCPSGLCDQVVHADISGNNDVGTDDFTFISLNFGKTDEPNCCAAAPSGLSVGETEHRGPLMRISTWQLRTMGLAELVVADLNGDGWVDQADIEAVAQGSGPVGVPIPSKLLRERRRK